MPFLITGFHPFSRPNNHLGSRHLSRRERRLDIKLCYSYAAALRAGHAATYNVPNSTCAELAKQCEDNASRDTIPRKGSSRVFKIRPRRLQVWSGCQLDRQMLLPATLLLPRPYAVRRDHLRTRYPDLSDSLALLDGWADDTGNEWDWPCC